MATPDQQPRWTTHSSARRSYQKPRRRDGPPRGLGERQKMKDVIRDTRAGSKQTQTVGILLKDWVGAVEIGTKQIEVSPVVNARRRESSESVPSK